MKPKLKTIATGEYSRLGYRVTVTRGPKVIHEYSAGNCTQESSTTILPQSMYWDSSIRVPLRELRSFCIQTTREIAKEFRAEYGGIERFEDDI